VPAWLLKTLAALLTAASAAGSAVFVSAHLKNPSAPLHPAVLPGGGPLSRLSLSLAGAAAGSAAAGEEIQIQPSVQAMADQAPLTSTYVS
jgi:hypothetical protein